MSTMSSTDVVSDASVVLKWFHDEGEQDVGLARGVLDLHRSRRIVLYVLDLTYYEVGNALMRGRARRTAEQTTTVLGAVRQICLTIRPDDRDLALATNMVTEHGLTLYDAAYAAVAGRRDAPLVTFDQQLLASGLGLSPERLLAQLSQPGI